MTYTTHFVGGILAAELLARHAGLSGTAPAVLALAAGGIGGLLPDADHPQSFIGRRLPLVSDVAFHTLGHRGALHGLLVCLLMYVAAKWLVAIVPFAVPGGALLAQALAAGYLSHLALDALNPQGIRPLWPLPWRLALPLVESGGILERAVVFPLVFLAALSLFLQMPGIFGETWNELTGAIGVPSDIWALLKHAWNSIVGFFFD